MGAQQRTNALLDGGPNENKTPGVAQHRRLVLDAGGGTGSCRRTVPWGTDTHAAISKEIKCGGKEDNKIRMVRKCNEAGGRKEMNWNACDGDSKGKIGERRQWTGEYGITGYGNNYLFHYDDRANGNKMANRNRSKRQHKVKGVTACVKNSLSKDVPVETGMNFREQETIGSVINFNKYRVKGKSDCSIKVKSKVDKLTKTEMANMYYGISTIIKSRFDGGHIRQMGGSMFV